MIILHSGQSKASRDFVELYGNKCEVLDWYNDTEGVAIYKMADYPNPRCFPSVFDPASRKLISEPATLLDAVRTIHGLDEDSILETRIIQVKTKTRELILEGFDYIKGDNTYHFPLSESDQFGFTAKRTAYTSADFPLTEGDATPPCPFANITEYKDAYRAGMTHIETKRGEGHVIEDSLTSLTYQQLLDWTDPRVGV